jgi:predicted phosphoribosyltransferase
MDICLVRKVSLLDHPAITIGAIAANSSMVLNYDVINSAGVAKAELNRITATAWKELQQWNWLMMELRPVRQCRPRSPNSPSIAQQK